MGNDCCNLGKQQQLQHARNRKGLKKFVVKLKNKVLLATMLIKEPKGIIWGPRKLSIETGIPWPGSAVGNKLKGVSPFNIEIKLTKVWMRKYQEIDIKGKELKWYQLSKNFTI